LSESKRTILPVHISQQYYMVLETIIEQISCIYVAFCCQFYIFWFSIYSLQY